MATSPSDAATPTSAEVPPELIAIAVALAATMFEPGADAVTPPPDVAAWRWQGWDSD